VQQQHIIQALQFELGKVTKVEVKQRMLTLLANIDTRLVTEVSASLGLPVPAGTPNTAIGTSPALRPENTPHLARTRQVAILVADGVDAADVATLRSDLSKAGLHSDVLAPHEGTVTGAGGKGSVPVAASIMTTDSVMYDALFVPGGSTSAATLMANADVLHFVQEAFKHYKTIGAAADGASVLTKALGALAGQPGVVTGTSSGAVAAAFVHGVAQDRHWDRTGAPNVPA
jgi:catalase